MPSSATASATSVGWKASRSSSEDAVVNAYPVAGRLVATTPGKAVDSPKEYLTHRGRHRRPLGEPLRTVRICCDSGGSGAEAEEDEKLPLELNQRRRL